MSELVVCVEETSAEEEDKWPFGRSNKGFFVDLVSLISFALSVLLSFIDSILLILFTMFEAMQVVDSICLI